MYFQVRRTILRKTPESLWLHKIKLLLLPLSLSHTWDRPAWVGGSRDGAGSRDGTLPPLIIRGPLQAAALLALLPRASLVSLASKQPATTDSVGMVFERGREGVRIASPHTGQSSVHCPSSMQGGIEKCVLGTAVE